jgi:hypothetical protein
LRRNVSCLSYRRIAAFGFGAFVGLATLDAGARAEAPQPPARVLGIQVTPGLKFLSNDPVTVLNFGNAGGAPQTSELGLGVTIIVLPRGWPLSLTVGGSYAASRGKQYWNRYDGYFEESASTFELTFGARRTFGEGKTRAFVGAGLGLGAARVRDDFAQGYESGGGGGSGGFAEAGAFARLNGLVDLGVFLRYSTFPFEWTPTIKAQYIDAGGLAVGLMVGFGP